MIIAGITGGIGHGKTTLALALAKQARSAHHIETWELVAEVANLLRASSKSQPQADDMEAINAWLAPLSDIVLSCVHIPIQFSDLRLTADRLAARPEHYTRLLQYLQMVAKQPDLAHLEIDVNNKAIYRPLLQWLGGYLVTIAGNGVWYDEIIRRITYLQNSGMELLTIGGVRYPGDAERLRNAGGVILDINRPDVPIADQHDLTERERRNIKADATIINNGNLSQLEQLAGQLFADLRLRQLTPEYIAQK